MHTATHLDKGEAGFSTRLRKIAQVNPPASIGSGRARVQAAADGTANAILKKGVKGRQWLKQALRDAEQKTGIKLLPEDGGDAVLSDAQLREAYGKASMLFFGIETPKVAAAAGTGATATQTAAAATAAPSSTAKAAAAWKNALHDSPLGHVLRADGRVHAAALKGAANTAASGMRVKKTKQKTATNETTQGNGAAATKRDAETASAPESERGRQAPNGQASKLTEPQQQKIRTPEFKQQFGDWEALSHQERFASFIEQVTANPQFTGSFDYRTVTREEAAAILSIGGPDTNGMRHQIDALHLRHAINQHSDPAIEAKRAQRPLDVSDLPRLLETLDAPDLISVKKGGRNNTKINYQKIFPDGTVVVAERAIETSRNNTPRLVFCTAWVATSSAGVKPSTAPVYTPGGQRYGTLANGKVNPDTISKIVDVNGATLPIYPLATQDGHGLSFTPDREFAAAQGPLASPVFLKGFTEGQDFTRDASGNIITVNSADQIIPLDGPDGSGGLGSPRGDAPASPSSGDTTGGTDTPQQQPARNPHRDAEGRLVIPGNKALRGQAELQALDAKFRELLADTAKADALYDALRESHGGKLLSTDIARKLLPEYAAGPDGAMRYLPATDAAAKAYVADRLWREINNPRGRRKFMMTGGGMGAGKSTVVTDEMIAHADLIFDGTLRNSDQAIATTNLAIAKDWGVEIHYVQRPIGLVAKGVISRANKEGRWLHLTNLLEAHREAQQSIVKIAKHFKDHPSVDISLWLNSGENLTETPTLINLDEIEAGGKYSYDRSDELHLERTGETGEQSAGSKEFREKGTRTINQAFQQAVNSGNYSPEILRRLAGDDAELQRIAAGAGGLKAEAGPRQNDGAGGRANNLPFNNPKAGPVDYAFTGRAKEVARQLQSLVDEIHQLDPTDASHTYHRARIVERARKLIEIPTRQRGTVHYTHVPTEVQGIAQQGADIAARYTHPSLLPRKVEVALIDGRPHADKFTVNLNEQRPDSAHHELMHCLEMQNPSALAASVKFLESRTVGETQVKLNELHPNHGYKDHEVTLQDLWVERDGWNYTGKVYKDIFGDYYATEILSTGIVRLHMNPLRFFRNDPDFFNFVINTLQPST